MKGRVIGALWIVGALLLSYFGFDGRYFNALIAFCLLMAMGEIAVIVVGIPWQMRPSACQPRDAWAWQMMILCFALLGCAVLTREQLAFAVIVATLTDVGAFACGMLWGKHRVDGLAEISPKKTLEGFIGGIVCSLLALICCPYLGILLTPQMSIFLALAGICAELGDLLGSATKRQLAIKDSGDGVRHLSLMCWLEFPLRGHGGYLDRVDSISLAVVLLTVIMMVP